MNMPPQRGSPKRFKPTVSSLWTDSGPSLVEAIVSEDAEVRDVCLAERCSSTSAEELLDQCADLEAFRRDAKNLYERVRALFFLYAIHRFHLPEMSSVRATGEIPYDGKRALLDRRFDDAIDAFLKAMETFGPSEAISSALSSAYHGLGFQTLADQVRLSVRGHPGNNWMFAVGSAGDHPRRFIPSLLKGKILRELTPVRMDLSHCGWSDIFFLGMDYPEGAKVLNISVDLAVRGRHEQPMPPIETYLRVIKDPVLRLTSVDLETSVDLTYISEVFDFAKDYLGLLKSGIVASGIVPPGLENSTETLSKLFETLGLSPGHGLHLVTCVNDIPKGSRLAVSTNLLGSIIAVGMRATYQTDSPTGTLTEEERRSVAARAILGEWLGGSGGGWQDSGGVWPGIKLIKGVHSSLGDPEYGISRGRLLPTHQLLDEKDAPASLRTALKESLVLVHGGMAQNVGPVLEMVTERYLLRDANEWSARQEAMNIFTKILHAFQESDVRSLANELTRNFFGPIQSIIPWATNLYTETLIKRTRERFGPQFWGFWMLGGMSGGGMGFIFDPSLKDEAPAVLLDIMKLTKKELEHALPFAMDPVVYDFNINENGTIASWIEGDAELHFQKQVAPQSNSEMCDGDHKIKESLDMMLADLGFDMQEHEKIRSDLLSGAIGLAQNRLPADLTLADVGAQDVVLVEEVISAAMRFSGQTELDKGTVGIVTLAGGVGSRWTQGAGCVKAINPFCKLGGKHRTFLEVHLAKSRRISMTSQKDIPHVFTTSHMTDEPIQSYLKRVGNHDYTGNIYCSRGQSIGLRLVPMIRDLKFAWEELQQQKMDEQAQKVKESLQSALMDWSRECGEASDYRNNLPQQCLHPVGHWFEVPNLLLNGTLRQMLEDRPQLQTLMLHNVDTVGADIEPGLLGLFLSKGHTLAFEVVPRRINDAGGGLARVDGHVRLVEGLAIPREEDELIMSYYNSMTTWINIDKLLQTFGLVRDDLGDGAKVADAVHNFSRRIPTYVTIKDVKRRWGNGQEDIHPVAQFEKLWGDMSALPDIDCGFFVVPRKRGQQLKDPSQLDGWYSDGSASFLEALCEWE